MQSHGICQNNLQCTMESLCMKSYNTYFSLRFFLLFIRWWCFEYYAVLHTTLKRPTTSLGMLNVDTNKMSAGTFTMQHVKSISDRDIICHQPLQRAVAMDFDRDKNKQKRSHRVLKEDATIERRSAFTIRLVCNFLIASVCFFRLVYFAFLRVIFFRTLAIDIRNAIVRREYIY